MGSVRDLTSDSERPSLHSLHRYLQYVLCGPVNQYAEEEHHAILIQEDVQVELYPRDFSQHPEYSEEASENGECDEGLEQERVSDWIS